MPVCQEVKEKFMKDAKRDRRSNITTTGNNGEPWGHLINAHEYYILKIKQVMGAFGLSNELILIQGCHYRN